MEFKDVVAKRYSCKKYSDRQVEKEKLEAILNAGRLAPTAKNLQEQRVYVIQSAEMLAKVDALTPCRYGAPTVIAVAFDRDNVFVYPGEKRDSGIEDASIVATHMMLAAEDEGVDSCWLNFFDPAGTPCYRVVNAKGELAGEFAFGGAGRQAELLRAEGIEVKDGKVELSRYGIKG